MNRFDYVIDKIQAAEFDQYPFRHIYVESLFTEEDFKLITASPEVDIPPVASDEELVEVLHKANFKEISFPGTTTDIPAYLQWHKQPAAFKNLNQATCEGYGVTMRLQKTTPNTVLAEAESFFRSDRFWRALADRFDLPFDKVRSDFGLQKYLDGYEISPHPDVRLKALTLMININPAANAEDLNYHTHYLTFKPEREYIEHFWRANKNLDRAWVPWDWCVSKKTQTKNNSIVIFSPNDDTLHAVKASYDHLSTQRTQFYGNLWYKEKTTTGSVSIAQLDKLATAWQREDA